MLLAGPMLHHAPTPLAAPMSTRAASVVMQGGMFDKLKVVAAGAAQDALKEAQRQASLAAMQDQEAIQDRQEQARAGPPVLGDAKTLPDSFEDSITIAVEACNEAVLDSNSRLVVEFDTSAGDETYNLLSRSLKLVQPMLKPLVDTLAPMAEVEDEAPAGEEPVEPPPRVQLLFPDEGTAAYARQNWGADLPPRTALGSMPRAQLAAGAEVLVFVAPQATEVQAVQRLLQQVAERAPTTIILLVNPKLVDMQSTGYGLVGRELRTMVAEQFAVPFALKTYPEGALYRVYPEGWTIWAEKPEAEGGYELAYKSSRRPSGDEIDEYLFAAFDDGEEGAGGGNPLDGLGAFIKGFQAM